MMASMAPGFPHPAAVQQHPGVPPGHPMAPGMQHNPSQPGAPTPGIPQHMAPHMAVSGPGGVQVNPAALMAAGIPPGGPNAHALQHLNPAQQMFQQQQAAMAAGQQFALNNPALAHQLQQQRMIQLQQQQQARQALMAQQYGGMGVNGMPMGVPMNQMTQAHLAQRMQNMPRAVLPPHLQKQQMAQQNPQQAGQNPQAQAAFLQQMAMQHQAQQQQQQHAGNMQGNNPMQPQMTPQQQMIHQAQVNAQLVHAQQQAAQVAQAQAQAHHAQAAQQQAQQQAAAAAANAAATAAAPPPQQQQPQPPTQPPTPANQQPPQTPQPQPDGASGPGPQNRPPTQPPTPAAQNQPPTTQAQQQATVVQHMQQQAAAAAAAAAAQQAAQNQAVANSMAMQQQRMKEGATMPGRGQFLLKLMQFAEHLSGFPTSAARGNRDSELGYWTQFVRAFFSQKGVLRHSVHVYGEGGTDKQYEITFPALARYFHTHFDSGVRNMQLIMEKGTMDKPLPDGGHYVENPRSSIVYWFDNGSHLVASGTLRVVFDAEQRIDLFEFLTSNHEEFVSRKMVIQAAKPGHEWIKEWMKVNSQDPKQSPEMSKKGKTKLLKSPQNQPPDFELPQSCVKESMGITEAVFQFLEISEVMGQMNPLFGFCQNNPNLAPYDALAQYVAQINAGQAQMNGQMQGGQARTASAAFGQFPVGASPAQPAHMNLPGASPAHMSGSPIPGHMQAPGMQLQQSQQGTAGTSSSGNPSANTSPASNKRRRPSAVKQEDDGTPGATSAPTPGGPASQVNGVVAGAKAKPPTPRMTKKQKLSNGP